MTMNVNRIIRRPWVGKVAHHAQVTVTLAPGKVFALTGKATQDFATLRDAYTGTNRLLIANAVDRYTRALYRHGVLYVAQDAGEWQRVGSFPDFNAACDYACDNYGINTTWVA